MGGGESEKGPGLPAFPRASGFSESGPLQRLRTAGDIWSFKL